MTKTLKRVIALLSVSMFMALFSLSCFAQENSSAKKIYTEGMALLRLSHYQKQTAWPGVQKPITLQKNIIKMELT